MKRIDLFNNRQVLELCKANGTPFAVTEEGRVRKCDDLNGCKGCVFCDCYDCHDQMVIDYLNEEVTEMEDK